MILQDDVVESIIDLACPEPSNWKIVLEQKSRDQVRVGPKDFRHIQNSKVRRRGYFIITMVRKMNDAISKRG